MPINWIDYSIIILYLFVVVYIGWWAMKKVSNFDDYAVAGRGLPMSIFFAAIAATLCGGGAKSPLWREILANVLGIPLTLPQTEQGPGYGGAMLAAVACGAYPSVQACAEALVHAKSTTQPDAALVEKYNARYAVWHKLYPALKVSFAEMEALQ